MILCSFIVVQVSKQLNRLYLKFLKRNPDYVGKVPILFSLFMQILISVSFHEIGIHVLFMDILQISIYGHSLGSVLSYDILCHQHNLSSPFPMDSVYKKFFPDEESPPTPASADRPCSSHPSSNFEPGKSNQLNNTEEITGQDNNMVAKESTVLEHHDVIQEAPSLISDSVVGNVGLERRGGQEDDHHDSSGAIPSQNGPDGADCRTPESPSCSQEQSWDKESVNSNNEETIKLLQDEVNISIFIFSFFDEICNLSSCKLSTLVFIASGTFLVLCSLWKCCPVSLLTDQNREKLCFH